LPIEKVNIALATAPRIYNMEAFKE